MTREQLRLLVMTAIPLGYTVITRYNGIHQQRALTEYYKLTLLEIDRFIAMKSLVIRNDTESTTFTFLITDKGRALLES